jgi:hypothetical protein
LKRFSNGDAHVGLLIIDWEKRDVEVRGMHPGNEVTVDEVLTALRTAEEKEVHALVYWSPEAVGSDLGQLCLYDEDTLLSEVGVEG